MKIGGVRQSRGSTVDQDGNVLDILVQSRRNANAARRFMAKLMKKRRGCHRISPYFRPRRHLLTAAEYRTEMHHRFETRNDITGTTAMPHHILNHKRNRPHHTPTHPQPATTPTT